MSENNIFNQYMKKTNTIIKNKKILQSDYIPDNLPHRDDKIGTIAEILAPALHGDKPSNILITGKTGTGKTAVMHFISNELKKANSTTGTKCFPVYINCEIIDTAYGILYNIANQIITDPAKRLPPTGWSMERILTEVTNIFESESKIFIIVLDEIDRSIQKNGEDIFYYLTNINSILKTSKISIVGITNNAKFSEFLNQKIRSRLGEEKVVFPPYNVEQLKDILYDRAKDAFDEGMLDDDVIPFCAAMSAQEIGDARRALDLLRMSAELAERNGDKKVTSAHVRLARDRIELDVTIEVVKTLTIQSKTVLFAMILNKESGMDFMTTGDVYHSYKLVCDNIELSILTQRRVAGLISELDMLGIVHARIKSFGRAGRTKEIELNIPQKIMDIVKDDELFHEYNTRKNSKQTTLM